MIGLFFQVFCFHTLIHRTHASGRCFHRRSPPFAAFHRLSPNFAAVLLLRPLPFIIFHRLLSWYFWWCRPDGYNATACTATTGGSEEQTTRNDSYGHTIRGGQGHVVPRDRILPKSEVIRAILLEYSPYRGVPYLGRRAGLLGQRVEEVFLVN